MNTDSKQTVVIFSGLPYSGKTAIIQRLLDRLPGEAVYVDGIFRDIVSEEEVCLERWLEEGTRLVDGIIEQITNSQESYIYVEVGIMQAEHRGRLMRWVRNGNYHLLPILLECESKKTVRQRQQARAKKRKFSISPGRSHSATTDCIPAFAGMTGSYPTSSFPRKRESRGHYPD